MRRGFLSASVLALIFAALASSSAYADNVRCKSKDYKYNFCSVGGPISYVTVRDRHSDRPCIQGQTWGWQKSGIWVNHGCDAEFEVTYFGERPGNGGGWGNDGGWGNGGSGWDQPAPQGPQWTVGQYRSRDAINGRNAFFTIYPGGSVQWNGPQGNYRGVLEGTDVVNLYGGPRLTISRDGFLSNNIKVRTPQGTYRFVLVN